MIGIRFILAATGGIILLADNPHGGEHLQELLVGQILWITWAQLIPAALISAGILLLWFRFGVNRNLGFYLLFAVSVTLSVQLVGVYLVFASLILPALASRRYSGGSALIAAYLIGAFGYGFGLIVSSILDLPSGAVIVWAIGGVALAVVRSAGVSPASCRSACFNGECDEYAAGDGCATVSAIRRPFLSPPAFP